ncbi:MAG: asparagine--tRNA ligase [Thermoanaerobaculia bacterium]
MVPPVYIADIAQHDGREVTLHGWLHNRRSSGKLHFLQVRDGTGVIQCVVFKGNVSAEVFSEADHLPQETSLRVTGTVKKDARSPIGFELDVKDLAVVTRPAREFPIGHKEHGVAFLMEQRHNWLRSQRQAAILRVRHTVEKAIRDFFDGRGFTLVDAPIFTPSACEGTSTLFEVPYFDLGKAYLTQSGQLYMEAAAMALGKVYCFGPTFRAEKSKTRRHLMEFWMVEPEVAFLEFEGLAQLAQEFVVYLVGRVLDRAQEELKILERDTAKLEAVVPPFPRITYTQAVEILNAEGNPIQWGDDFGADEETIVASRYDRPVLVTHFPAVFKAFYMQPSPESEPGRETVLGLDIIAPEGYGEIIGGSQRIHDHDLLLERIRHHNLPIEAFQWYLDVRRYGSFLHSGFGMGIERFVAWMSGVSHLRETIPYPRMLYKIYP